MKKMRKLISTLLSISMMTAIPMTTSVFAQNSSDDGVTPSTQNTSVITLAYENFSDYRNENGVYPQGVQLNNFPKADNTATEDVDERLSDVNGGYGWDGKWYNGTDKTNPNFGNIAFTEAYGTNGVYGWGDYGYRDLENSISLSEAGTYIFETKLYTNGGWNDKLAGIGFLTEDNNEVLSFGVFGREVTTTKDNGTEAKAQYYDPGFKVGNNKIVKETNFNNSLWYTAKVVVTVNPNGNDTVVYTLENSNVETIELSSSEVELGNGVITKIKGSWGQPTYINSITLKKEVNGTTEMYGETTVGSDNFMVKEYGYDSTGLAKYDDPKKFDPSASLGTGWSGPWTFVNANSELKYYFTTDWRSEVACSENENNSEIYRNFSKAIDFSKDGKYVISYKDKNYQHDTFKVMLCYGTTNVFGISKNGRNGKVTVTAGDTTKETDVSEFLTEVYQNKIEITVNSKGKDTVKFKKYKTTESEPDTYLANFECELDGKIADNVRIWYYSGGVADISIETNAVTVTRQETENGEKIYVDFAMPAKTNTVSMPGNDNMTVSYVKDSDGKIYSAVVEYNKADLVGLAGDGIVAGDVVIPVEVDKTAFSEEKIIDTIISDDFGNYIDTTKAIKNTNNDRYSITDDTALKGGSGFKGNWTGNNWSLGYVGNLEGIWSLGSSANITRDFEKELDFSKEGQYEISFNFMRQYGWSTFTGVKFLDSDNNTVLSFGVKGLTNVIENKDQIQDSERPIVCTATINGKENVATTNFATGGLGNVFNTMKVSINVDSEGKADITVKCFNNAEKEDTGAMTLTDVSFDNVKSSKLKLDLGVPGGFGKMNIRKNVGYYRKTSDKVYMFFDNDYVANTNNAYAVSFDSDSKLSSVKYAQKAENFSVDFGTNNTVKVFVWDNNLKPVLDTITITK